MNFIPVLSSIERVEQSGDPAPAQGSVRCSLYISKVRIINYITEVTLREESEESYMGHIAELSRTESQ